MICLQTAFREDVQKLTDDELFRSFFDISIPTQPLFHLHNILAADENPLRQDDTHRYPPHVIQKTRRMYELLKRTLSKGLEITPASQTPIMIKKYIHFTLSRMQQEVCYLFLLSVHHQVICHTSISKGSYTQVPLCLRSIIRLCLQHDAAAVILAHNHPAGTQKPSAQDVRETQKAKSILELLNITLLDHLLVTERGCISFKEYGLL
jgi:DNA repair protein RadC